MYLISLGYYMKQAFYVLPREVRLCFFSGNSESVEINLFIHGVISPSLKIKLNFEMDCFTCSHFINFPLQLPAQVGFRSMLQISVEGNSM